MAGFYNLKGLTEIFFGSKVVQEVRLGSTLLWQALKAYNFSTTTNFGPIEQSVWVTVHSHTVVGSGVGTVYSRWLFNSTWVYTAVHLRAVRIRKNGVVLGGWDHGGNVVNAKSWDFAASIPNLSLVEGDVITLEAYASANNTNLRTISEHTFKLTPI